MKEKIQYNALFLCEGKYDKIKLSSFIDATIVATNGFSIYKDEEKLLLIKKLSQKMPVVILTDGDSAGFQIRNFLKKYLQNAVVHHVYIPDIYGKEKRKTQESKEGKIGVEGIKGKILIEKIEQVLHTTKKKEEGGITVNHLYFAGLLGVAGAKEKRNAFLKRIDLPQHISTNALLQVLNILFTEEEFSAKIVEKGHI